MMIRTKLNGADESFQTYTHIHTDTPNACAVIANRKTCNAIINVNGVLSMRLYAVELEPSTTTTTAFAERKF